MVGVMVNVLFGTSLHVSLLMIEICRNEHFCKFKEPPEARMQS